MENHHHSISAGILRFLEYANHIMVEGDFSEKDMYPLPYDHNATMSEMVMNIEKELTNTKIKIRALEYHSGPAEEIDHLERHYAALEKHADHIRARR